MALIDPFLQRFPKNPQFRDQKSKFSQLVVKSRISQKGSPEWCRFRFFSLLSFVRLLPFFPCYLSVFFLFCCFLRFIFRKAGETPFARPLLRNPVKSVVMISRGSANSGFQMVVQVLSGAQTLLPPATSIEPPSYPSLCILFGHILASAWQPQWL